MRLSHSLALGLLLAGSLAAHADTLQTFNVSAVLGNNTGTGGSVSGSIIIDTTTGVVSSSNLSSIYGSTTYAVSSTVTHSSALGNGSAFDLSFGTPGAAGSAFLSLVLPVASLVNYTGGTVCFETRPCSQAGSNFTSSYFAPGAQFGDQLASGYLSLVVPPAPPVPPVSVTPEPSSLVLMATGMLTVATAGRRRYGASRA